MYRLSPSKIDQFRIYRDEVFPMTKEELIERLTTKPEKSEAMIFGSDVHEFIEKGTVRGLMTEEIEYLTPFRELWAHRVKEQWAEIDLFQGADSLMRIDMIYGNQVEDIKVTGRYNGVDHYEKSVQWKMYLMATGAKEFRYHIFQKKGTKRPFKFDYHNFEFFAYESMEDDVKELARQTINFCEINGIAECIKPKNYE